MSSGFYIYVDVKNINNKTLDSICERFTSLAAHANFNLKHRIQCLQRLKIVSRKRLWLWSMKHSFLEGSRNCCHATASAAAFNELLRNRFSTVNFFWCKTILKRNPKSHSISLILGKLHYFLHWKIFCMTKLVSHRRNSNPQTLFADAKPFTSKQKRTLSLRGRVSFKYILMDVTSKDSLVEWREAKCKKSV